MLSSIYSLILFLISVFAPSDIGAMAKKGPNLPFNNDAVGVQTFHYEDETRSRPVIVELWYPTDDTVSSSEILEDVWIHPKEARDVALSNKLSSYPLILMSHGHRGDRRERTWLADALARQGYIVASVEHHGNAWHKFDPELSCRFWERAKDVSFMLTKIINEPSLKDRIDQERIGFVGYSMGGMTGLSLAGAKAKHAKQIAYALNEKAKAVPAEVFEKLDFSEAENDFSEPRIHSILLICPATFAFFPETLKDLKTPIGLIASVDDEVLPHNEHAAKILEHAPPRKIKILSEKVSHYAFLNQMTEKGCQILNKGVKTPKDLNWKPIHKEATDFAIAYFEETLPAKK